MTTLATEPITTENIPGTEAFPLAPETAGYAPTSQGRIAMARAAILHARVEVMTQGGAFRYAQNRVRDAAERVHSRGGLYKAAGLAIAVVGTPTALALLNKGIHLEINPFDAAPQTQAQPSVLDLDQHPHSLVAETQAVPTSHLHNVDIKDDEGSQAAAHRMGMSEKEATHFALSDDADAKEARAALVKSGDAYWAEEKGGVIGWDHSHEISDKGMKALQAYDFAEHHGSGAELPHTPAVETPEGQPATATAAVEKALDGQLPPDFTWEYNPQGNFIEITTPSLDTHRIELTDGAFDKHGKLTEVGHQEIADKLKELREQKVIVSTNEQGTPAEEESNDGIDPNAVMTAGSLSVLGITASTLIPSGIRQKRQRAKDLLEHWKNPDGQEQLLRMLDKGTQARFARSFANRMPLKSGRLTPRRVEKQFSQIENVSASVRRQLIKRELTFLPKDERPKVAQELIERLHAEMGITGVPVFHGDHDPTTLYLAEREFVAHVWVWTGQFKRGTVRPRDRRRLVPAK